MRLLPKLFYHIFKKFAQVLPLIFHNFTNRYTFEIFFFILLINVSNKRPAEEVMCDLANAFKEIYDKWLWHYK